MAGPEILHCGHVRGGGREESAAVATIRHFRMVQLSGFSGELKKRKYAYAIFLLYYFVMLAMLFYWHFKEFSSHKKHSRKNNCCTVSGRMIVFLQDEIADSSNARDGQRGSR